MGGDSGLVPLCTATSLLVDAGVSAVTFASVGDSRLEADAFLEICSLTLGSRIVGSMGSEEGK